jgi:hypothetical protein
LSRGSTERNAQKIQQIFSFFKEDSTPRKFNRFFSFFKEDSTGNDSQARCLFSTSSIPAAKDKQLEDGMSGKQTTKRRRKKKESSASVLTERTHDTPPPKPEPLSLTPCPSSHGPTYQEQQTTRVLVLEIRPRLKNPSPHRAFSSTAAGRTQIGYSPSPNSTLQFLSPQLHAR